MSVIREASDGKLERFMSELEEIVERDTQHLRVRRERRWNCALDMYNQKKLTPEKAENACQPRTSRPNGS
jgi:hypothetical protein